MKTRVLILALIAAILPLSACSTTQQQVVAADSQQVADAIRHAEDAGFSPAEFNAFVQNYVALIPQAQPYIPAAELAFAGLYEGGNLTAAALERVATKYDTKPASPAAAVVSRVTPATVVDAFKQVAAIGNP